MSSFTDGLIQLSQSAGAGPVARLRVCLVIPPSPFLLDERVFASLGILKVAAELEPFHEVSVVDLSGVENYLDAVDVCPPADVFGITATTPQMPAAMKIGARLRRNQPASRLILGGPHVTLVHAAARSEERKHLSGGRSEAALAKLAANFDVLVAGDGEKAIHAAVRPDSPALIDADDPKTPLFMTHDEFTQSAWPARHLIDLDSYRYKIDGHKATSLVAQLGCPFQCSFCAGRLSPMLRKIRLRDRSNVIDELRMLHTRHGYTGFMFYDDELNVNKNLVPLMRDLIRLQKELGVKFALRGFVKSELFNEEQAEVLQEAGFNWLLCGFESGSPRILRNIRKMATTEDNSRMLQIAHRYGIRVKALMSLGHAGESAETVAETEQWLIKERPDEFDATVITVYPGSPYYDQAVHHKDDVWRFETCGDSLYFYDLDFTEEQAYYKGTPGEYKSFVFTDHLSGADLVRLRDQLEERVRRELNIPWQTGAAARRYEHSMGMGLPDSILRSTPATRPSQQKQDAILSVA